MDGMLDADVEAGCLTHEKARRLKEQVNRGQHQRLIHATAKGFESDAAESDALDGDRKSLFSSGLFFFHFLFYVIFASKKNTFELFFLLSFGFLSSQKSDDYGIGHCCHG